MLFDKLRQIEERSHEIARVLSDPAIFGQPAEYARLRKEHADTLEVVEKFTEYRDVLKRLGEARHILAEGGDRELAELAQAETRRRCSPPSSRACIRSTRRRTAGRSK